jgi:hypothetical protein
MDDVRLVFSSSTPCDFLSGFVWSEALCSQIVPVCKIAIRRDAAHFRRSFKGDSGSQIESGTSVILKLQEECGELIVVFEPHPSNCFPFQLRVFDAFMTHGVNPSGGKETVLGAILTAQDAYIPPHKHGLKLDVPL